MDNVYTELAIKYKEEFENYAESVFSSVTTDTSLSDAMKYSFFASGKRVRPVLMLATADFLGGDKDKVLPFALALECAHTYSLVHDDLPALDNDVLRRGKPTNHVKYGEATAILAGDGLLNFAFEHVLSVIDDKKGILCAKLLAEYSGYSGMLGGQKADLEHEGVAVATIEELDSIYDRKTGKFLTLPFLIPCVLFGGDLAAAEETGVLLGRAFQYNDDLLDVSAVSSDIGKTAGKDAKAKKLTAVSLLGADGVKTQVSALTHKILDVSKSLINAEFMDGFMCSVFGGGK